LALQRDNTRPRTQWLVAALAVVVLASGCAQAGQTSAPIQTEVPSATQTAPPPSPTSSGSASEAPALHLVALGDSIAASKLCQCPRYPDVYSRLAAEALDQPVRAENIAVNGATSADLLYRLENMQPFQTAVRGADLITISIGFNDIGPCVVAGTEPKCYATAIAGLKTTLEAIHDKIDTLQGDHPHILRETTYYDYYVGRSEGPQSTPAFHAFYVDQLASLNATICAAVVAHDGLCIDLLPPFNGPAGDQDAGQFLVKDHIHPGTTGHELIAETIDAAGYAPLRP
jgi:lysophospholipase L1-like esterase